MKKTFSLFTFLVLAFSSILAQQISAEKIAEKYLEAVGGAEAWKKINTMKTTGEAQLSGFTFPVTLITMRPNYQRFDVDVQGQKVIEAFDGDVAWTLNPFMGSIEPTKKSEDETKEAAKQMFEDEFIDYAAKGHSITFEGEEEIEGTKTYKVKMMKKNGDEAFYFFDKENFVPIAMRSFVKAGPMKGKAVDVFLSDYMEVNGVVLPHYMEQKVDGAVMMNLKTTKVEFNVPLEKLNFSFPNK
jgi:hypothetical protein